MARITGRVMKVMPERGYGFIETEPPGEDVFFHASALSNARIDQVRVGDKVEFEITKPSGRPRAIDVMVLTLRDGSKREG